MATKHKKYCENYAPGFFHLFSLGVSALRTGTCFSPTDLQSQRSSRTQNKCHREIDRERLGMSRKEERDECRAMCTRGSSLMKVVSFCFSKSFFQHFLKCAKSHRQSRAASHINLLFSIFHDLDEQDDTRDNSNLSKKYGIRFLYSLSKSTKLFEYGLCNLV